MNAVRGIWQFNLQTRHEIAEIIIASNINLQIMIEKVKLVWLLINTKMWVHIKTERKSFKSFMISEYSILCVATTFVKADLNAVLALQGISPGQNAHDAAIARWSSFSDCN